MASDGIAGTGNAASSTYGTTATVESTCGVGDLARRLWERTRRRASDSDMPACEHRDEPGANVFLAHRLPENLMPSAGRGGTMRAAVGHLAPSLSSPGPAFVNVDHRAARTLADVAAEPLQFRESNSRVQGDGPMPRALTVESDQGVSAKTAWEQQVASGPLPGPAPGAMAPVPAPRDILWNAMPGMQQPSESRFRSPRHQDESAPPPVEAFRYVFRSWGSAGHVVTGYQVSERGGWMLQSSSQRVRRALLAGRSVSRISIVAIDDVAEDDQDRPRR